MRRPIELSLLGIAILVGAVPAAAQSVEEIEACMRRNIPARTSVQTVELRSTDAGGGERVLQGKIYWKRSEEGFSRTLIEVEAPPADRGSAYLWLEYEDRQDAFVYLPELRRARRIHPRSASGTLFGTDFSYEDVQHLQRISGGGATAERLPDVRLEGRTVSVVRTSLPEEEGSAYETIVHHIDQESCVPLKIEFYEKGGNLRKLLRVDPDSITHEGAGWIARSVEIRDLVHETQSRLAVKKIKLDAKVPDRLFSVTRLERGSR